MGLFATDSWVKTKRSHRWSTHYYMHKLNTNGVLVPQEGYLGVKMMIGSVLYVEVNVKSVVCTGALGTRTRTTDPDQVV